MVNYKVVDIVFVPKPPRNSSIEHMCKKIMAKISRLPQIFPSGNLSKFGFDFFSSSLLLNSHMILICWTPKITLLSPSGHVLEHKLSGLVHFFPFHLMSLYDLKAWTHSVPIWARSWNELGL